MQSTKSDTINWRKIPAKSLKKKFPTKKSVNLMRIITKHEPTKLPIGMIYIWYILKIVFHSPQKNNKHKFSSSYNSMISYALNRVSLTEQNLTLKCCQYLDQTISQQKSFGSFKRGTLNLCRSKGSKVTVNQTLEPGLQASGSNPAKQQIIFQSSNFVSL